MFIALTLAKICPVIETFSSAYSFSCCSQIASNSQKGDATEKPAGPLFTQEPDKLESWYQGRFLNRNRDVNNINTFLAARKKKQKKMLIYFWFTCDQFLCDCFPTFGRVENLEGFGKQCELII